MLTTPPATAWGPAEEPSLHALRGIRFRTGEGGALPSAQPTTPAVPPAPAPLNLTPPLPTADPPAPPAPTTDPTDWKAEARKWEQRAKENTDRIAQLEQATQTDAERAINAAREEGRAEVRQVLAAERVRAALAAALTGRVPDAGALLDLDRSRFVRGEGADTDAIRQWVEANSTATTAVVTPPPPAVTVTPDPSQGGGGGAGATTDAGRAAYERRHPKKTP